LTPVWILREGQNIPKLDAKTETHIFVGFIDSPKAIKYYNAQTRQIKVSRNYRFTAVSDTLTPEPNVEFEGEGQGLTSKATNSAPGVDLQRTPWKIDPRETPREVGHQSHVNDGQGSANPTLDGLAPGTKQKSNTEEEPIDQSKKLRRTERPHKKYNYQ
jgi:hypothetical protein